MSFALLYWILMLICAFFSLWPVRPNGSAGPRPFRPWIEAVMLYVLLMLLGWKVFGPPVHN
jgi:hypothetical protein